MYIRMFLETGDIVCTAHGSGGPGSGHLAKIVTQENHKLGFRREFTGIHGKRAPVSQISV